MGKDKAFLPFDRSDLAHFLYEKCNAVFPKTYLCFKNAVCIDVPTIIESTPPQRIRESKRVDSLNKGRSVQEAIYLPQSREQECRFCSENTESSAVVDSENSQRMQQSESKELYAPLYGIACAFVNLTSPYIAFVSVDTPFVNIQDMRRLYDMVSHSRAKGGYITQIDSNRQCVREHFLLSVWHRDCLLEIKQAIEAKAFRLQRLVRELGFISLNVCDENLAYNLNTPQDYTAALEHLGAL